MQNKFIKIIILLLVKISTLSKEIPIVKIQIDHFLSIEKYCEKSDKKTISLKYKDLKLKNTNESKKKIYKLERGYIMEEKKILKQNNEDWIYLFNELKIYNEFKNDLGFEKLRSCFYYDDLEENLDWRNVFIEKEDYFDNLFNLLESNLDITKSFIWRLDLALKISKELKIMHDLDIGHFNLNPMNIKMLNSLTPLISNFNFSMNIKENYSELFKKNNYSRTEIVGKIEYIPQETELKIYKKSNDIYSLGIIFTQLFKNKKIRKK